MIRPYLSVWISSSAGPVTRAVCTPWISGRRVTGNFGGIDFDQTGEVELPKGLGEAGGGKGPVEKF